MNLMVKTAEYEFLNPDPLWEVFGINSQQEYIKNYVIKGRFHSKVPEVVRNDFKIVERLLFYSYYNYPMLDEVYSKLTRMFESSVNLRIKELEIEIGNRSGLYKKLELLQPYITENLAESLDRVRKLRNNLAHPNAGNMFGIAIFNGVYVLSNLLNQLFLDNESRKEYDSKVDTYALKSKHLQEGLFILKYQHSNILIESGLPVALGGNTKNPSSLWVFHPVLNRFSKTKDDYELSYPIIISLKEVQLKESGIVAQELYSRGVVEFVKTKKKENLIKQKEFKHQVFDSKPEVVKMHMSFVEDQILQETEKFMQAQRWE